MSNAKTGPSPGPPRTKDSLDVPFYWTSCCKAFQEMLNEIEEALDEPELSAKHICYRRSKVSLGGMTRPAIMILVGNDA